MKNLSFPSYLCYYLKELMVCFEYFKSRNDINRARQVCIAQIKLANIAEYFELGSLRWDIREFLKDFLFDINISRV